MPPQDDDAPKSRQSVDDLLNEIPTVRRRWRIYRLASLPEYDKRLAELELDDLSEQELSDLLVDTGYKTSLEEPWDAPFRPKRYLNRATRYSDGSYPVFYSALDLATAKAEVKHGLKKGFGGRPKVNAVPTIGVLPVRLKAKKRTSETSRASGRNWCMIVITRSVIELAWKQSGWNWTV